MKLVVITEASRLSKSKLYQIEGTLYRFVFSDPYARVDHPQYLFRPLAGQRKRADRVLNIKKLALFVYELEGFHVREVSMSGNHIQMELRLNLE